MARQKIIVDDLVRGVIGSFVKKEQAPGYEDRVVIYYHSPSVFAKFGKPKKIEANIPKQGILEVPGTQTSDGIGRIIIFSYGDDAVSPPLIMSLLQDSVGDLIKLVEKMRKEYSIKMTSVDTKDRILKRSESEEVQRHAAELKEMERTSGGQKGRFGTFVDRMSRGE